MDERERKPTALEALQEWRDAARALETAKHSLVEAERALARAERSRLSAEDAHEAAKKVLAAARTAVKKTGQLVEAARRDSSAASDTLDDRQVGVDEATVAEGAAHEQHREAQGEAYERQHRDPASVPDEGTDQAPRAH